MIEISSSYPIQGLTSETVDGLSLSLESVDDIQRRDSLSLGVLSVGDGISDDTLEESLEDSSSLLVDESRDTLDTSSSSKTSDGRLSDSLDVVSQDLSVSLARVSSKCNMIQSRSEHTFAPPFPRPFPPLPRPDMIEWFGGA